MVVIWLKKSNVLFYNIFLYFVLETLVVARNKISNFKA